MVEHIAVLGAAFDPPTKGHEDVVNQALQAFDTVLLVPSVRHPFGKAMTPLPNRLEMLAIFAKTWAKNRHVVEVFNIEQSILLTNPTKEPIYTHDVLEKLTETLSTLQRKVHCHFIVGPDNLVPEVWEKFYKHDEIEKNWPLFKAKENVSIRSSDVRKKLKSINASPRKLLSILIPLVGEPLARYIIAHQLYEITVFPDNLS